MLAINGWQVFAHPLFLSQIDRLATAVALRREQDPDGYASDANFKVLAAIRKLVFETIPADPTRSDYRQGATLGSHRKHWFRAKFGGQRFRLFFRFDTRARIIIFAWVNDAQTLRSYGSRTDAYAVFRGMLDKGDPPDDWPSLLAAASAKVAAERLKNERDRSR